MANDNEPYDELADLVRGHSAPEPASGYWDDLEAKLRSQRQNGGDAVGASNRPRTIEPRSVDRRSSSSGVMRAAAVLVAVVAVGAAAFAFASPQSGEPATLQTAASTDTAEAASQPPVSSAQRSEDVATARVPDPGDRDPGDLQYVVTRVLTGEGPPPTLDDMVDRYGDSRTVTGESPKVSDCFAEQLRIATESDPILAGLAAPIENLREHSDRVIDHVASTVMVDALHACGLSVQQLQEVHENAMVERVKKSQPALLELLGEHPCQRARRELDTAAQVEHFEHDLVAEFLDLLPISTSVNPQSRSITFACSELMASIVASHGKLCPDESLKFRRLPTLSIESDPDWSETDGDCFWVGEARFWGARPAILEDGRFGWLIESELTEKVFPSSAPPGRIGLNEGREQCVSGIEAGDVLNVRTAPNRDAVLLGELAPGRCSIRWAGESSGSWRRVTAYALLELNGEHVFELTGWVSGNYLAPPSLVNSPEAATVMMHRAETGYVVECDGSGTSTAHCSAVSFYWMEPTGPCSNHPGLGYWHLADAYRAQIERGRDGVWTVVSPEGGRLVFDC